MSKQSSAKNPHVILRPAVADTIRAIKPGTSVTFKCTDLAPYSSACGRVSQLNAAAGNPIYSIKSLDNGISYTITRRAE